MVHSVKPTIGRYALGERIDFGGPGDVYRALYRREQVAIRLLPTTLTADLDFTARFEREMGRLTELDHPRLIPILGYGQQDGTPYVVTALDYREHLRDRFARNRPLPEELLAYLRQIADALDYAHAQGVTHGDLQPSSVLLNEDGSAHLSGTGLALICERDGSAGALAAGDPRADVAALARIAHQGLTGNLSAAALSGASSPGLSVIRRALAKEYASAGAFVRDFAQAQAGSPAEASAPADERAPRTATRRPTASHAASRLRVPQALAPKSAAGQRVVALWVAGFVLAVVLIGGAIVVLNRRGDTAPTNAGGPAPAASKAPVSIAPTGDLLIYFPVDNALIARRYAESQRKLPPEAADGKLHRFSAECSNPRAGEDCLLVYVFYSQQADLMYNYHYKVREDALVGEFTEPAQNDDYRITLRALPWEKNPNWTGLINESYAQLPANYAPNGFSAGLYASAAANNNGTADWAMVYIESGSDKQYIFQLLGDQVTKQPE